jgi:hypothetical protein
VSEDLTPHRLTSCPDDHHLAVVQTVCSSSCLRPVTRSHINMQNSKLQGMPLRHCSYTYCHKHTQSEVSTVLGISVLAHCGQLTNGPSFQFPSNHVSGIFPYAVYNTLSICMHYCNSHYNRHSTAIHIKTNSFYILKVCNKLQIYLTSGHPHKLLFGAD